MTASSSDSTSKREKIWLGLTVGWLTQLGLKTFVPIVALIGIRFYSFETNNPTLWMENPGDSTHPVWYALQTTVFLSSLCAGALGAYLSQGRYWMLALGLTILSLMTTFFEQFPIPPSTIALWFWAGGPCLGVVAGVGVFGLFHKTKPREMTG